MHPSIHELPGDSQDLSQLLGKIPDMALGYLLGQGSIPVRHRRKDGAVFLIFPVKAFLGKGFLPAHPL